ncbi:class I SAM-dependent methyltransferase [Microcoleus sp. A2-C5]|uniref:class I SAM-dependent methyltransferase n=1 Tax=unclassified Microcoleus TaxID=2642155 RepID=UPI002FD26BD2
MLDFIKYKQNFLESTKDWDNEKWNNFNDNPLVLVSPILDNCHVKNCRVVNNRFKMLEYLPKNAVVAEVGTQYGQFAEAILSITKPKKLHLLDYNFDLFKTEISQKEKTILQEGIANGTVELHEGDSSTILSSFPDEYFDWIYIDADHAYEGVCKDIQQGYPKVKPDGMMIFNDYTNWSVCEVMPYGVAKAVNEFCIANNWEIVFLALHGLGYHDIALKKNTGEKEVRIQLQEAKSELENSQLQMQQLELKLEQAKSAIDFMENDKFWKLRSHWMKIKQIFS